MSRIVGESLSCGHLIVLLVTERGVTNFIICDTDPPPPLSPPGPPGPLGWSHTRQATAHLMSSQHSWISIRQKLSRSLNWAQCCAGCRGNSLMQILPGQFGFYSLSSLGWAAGGWRGQSSRSYTNLGAAGERREETYHVTCRRPVRVCQLFTVSSGDTGDTTDILLLDVPAGPGGRQTGQSVRLSSVHRELPGRRDDITLSPLCLHINNYLCHRCN